MQAIRSAAETAQDRGLELARLSILRAAEFDLRGSSEASADAARWFMLAAVLACIAPRDSDLDGGTSGAHLDADDADESGSASCAAEGTGGLVVNVTAPADDEGIHDEEGS